MNNSGGALYLGGNALGVIAADVPNKVSWEGNSVLFSSIAGSSGGVSFMNSCYEVIECSRRILLFGIIVFIYPNSAAKVAETLVLAVFFMVLSEVLAPYVSRSDAWISLAGYAVVFSSTFVALLLKVGMSSERASSQRGFEVVLVSVNVGMILTVAVEAVMMGCSLRKGEEEVLRPNLRRTGHVWFFHPVENDPLKEEPLLPVDRCENGSEC